MSWQLAHVDSEFTNACTRFTNRIMYDVIDTALISSLSSGTHDHVAWKTDLYMLEVRNLVGSSFNDLESGIPRQVLW